MHEKLFPSDSPFFENTNFAEILQIPGGRMALGDCRLREILNPAIRLLKKQID